MGLEKDGLEKDVAIGLNLWRTDSLEYSAAWIIELC